MNEKTSLRWAKRIVSLISVGYGALVCLFSYLSLFYKVTIPNKPAFCIALCAVSLVSLAAMLFSRYVWLTRFIATLMLLVTFPLVLMCFGEWELIVPIAVTSLLIFFLSGAGEKVKTVFGIIYLLIYLLGSLAFFMLGSVFTTSETQTTLETGTSPSGAYRYEVLETQDSSGGDVEVHVEPNDRDIDLPLISFAAQGYDRTVYLERPLTDDEDFSVTWETQDRDDITQELLTISDDITLSLTEEQRETLGIADNVETVYLRTMTDDQLEKLGVPEENDVLIFHGKVCFRTYTAVLEEYFAPENREWTIFS